MRLGAIDLHLFPARARALEKLVSSFLMCEPNPAFRFTAEQIRELEELKRILEAKLAVAKPRHG